jgi:hypothetical protein
MQRRVLPDIVPQDNRPGLTTPILFAKQKCTPVTRVFPILELAY